MSKSNIRTLNRDLTRSIRLNLAQLCLSLVQLRTPLFNHTLGSLRCRPLRLHIRLSGLRGRDLLIILLA